MSKHFFPNNIRNSRIKIIFRELFSAAYFRTWAIFEWMFLDYYSSTINTNELHKLGLTLEEIEQEPNDISIGMDLAFCGHSHAVVDARASVFQQSLLRK